MLKIEDIKWAVIKSDKPISKSLTSKLNKVRVGSTQENTYSFYYFKDSEFERVVSLLRGYKYKPFEVVKFYDKQFGLTLNYWGGDSKNKDWFDNKIDRMPLSHKFSWFTNNNRVSLTPITSKQFNAIIKINLNKKSIC